ncbi:hypothetical protein HanRHA438_Chr06g0273041 [Helianthus annuus]|nr:hypothetical protein HanRHA438_Chr06g0273041 [Helianthus annuus]
MVPGQMSYFVYAESRLFRFLVTNALDSISSEIIMTKCCVLLEGAVIERLRIDVAMNGRSRRKQCIVAYQCSFSPPIVVVQVPVKTSCITYYIINVSKP